MHFCSRRIRLGLFSDICYVAAYFEVGCLDCFKCLEIFPLVVYPICGLRSYHVRCLLCEDRLLYEIKMQLVLWTMLLGIITFRSKDNGIEVIRFFVKYAKIKFR